MTACAVGSRGRRRDWWIRRPMNRVVHAHIKDHAGKSGSRRTYLSRRRIAPQCEISGTLQPRRNQSNTARTSQPASVAHTSAPAGTGAPEETRPMVSGSRQLRGTSKTTVFRERSAEALATARPRRRCSSAVLRRLATQPGGRIGATTGTVDFSALFALRDASRPSGPRSAPRENSAEHGGRAARHCRSRATLRLSRSERRHFESSATFAERKATLIDRPRLTSRP